GADLPRPGDRRGVAGRPQGPGAGRRPAGADAGGRVHRAGRAVRRGRRCGMSDPLRRVRALLRKEYLQILRDPSAYLIAGVLPLVLLVIFGTGVSLDLRQVRVAVVVEQPTPEATGLLEAYRNSRYFIVREARHRAAVEGELVAGRLAGVIVVPADFAERLGK